MGHPLFAAARHADIGFVQVRRREGDGWKRAPGTLRAEELADQEALEQRFGGGQYELVARCSKNRRITARVRLTVEGEPKPLEPTPRDDDTPAEEPSPHRPHGGAASSARLEAMLAEGRVQARVFRMFERRSGLSEIVRATRLPVQEVRRLWNEHSRPLDDSMEQQTQWMEREADRFDQQRLERERLDHERRRADQAHELGRKHLELVERALKLRERELARGRGAPSEPATDPAGDKLMESILSMLANFAPTGGARGDRR